MWSRSRTIHKRNVQCNQRCGEIVTFIYRSTRIPKNIEILIRYVTYLHTYMYVRCVLINYKTNLSLTFIVKSIIFHKFPFHAQTIKALSLFVIFNIIILRTIDNIIYGVPIL